MNDMKLIMEGWKTFLNEVKGSSLKNDEGTVIGSLLSGVIMTPFLGHASRTVVAVDVKGHGPIAFYRSTGTGTPELDTGDMWLPCGGASYQGNGDPWLIKWKGGKVPPEGHAFRAAGVALARLIPESDNGRSLWEWGTSMGYPSMDELKKTVGTTVFGPMLFNRWLNKHKALQPGWAPRALAGSKQDTFVGPFQQTLDMIKQKVSQL
jgi:hypothetical protein